MDNTGYTDNTSTWAVRGGHLPWPGPVSLPSHVAIQEPGEAVRMRKEKGSLRSLRPIGHDSQVQVGLGGSSSGEASLSLSVVTG